MSRRVKSDDVPVTANGEEVLQTLMDVEARVRTLSDRCAVLRAGGESDLAGAFLAAADGLGRRLGHEEPAIAVLSARPQARAALLDTITSARVFAAARRPSSAPVLVRFAPVIDYVVRFRDGSVEQFGLSTPEENDVFTKALAWAEKRRGEADTALEQARSQRRAVERTAPPSGAPSSAPHVPLTNAETKEPPATETALARPRGSLFGRFGAWLSSWFGLRKDVDAAVVDEATTRKSDTVAPRIGPPVVKPADSTSELVLTDLALQERRLASEEMEAKAQADVAKAKARLHEVRSDREKHRGERREAFLAGLRALADTTVRGADVLEIRIELPSTHVVRGVTLISIPDAVSGDPSAQRAARDMFLAYDVEGCILLDTEDVSAKVRAEALQKMVDFSREELRLRTPHTLHGTGELVTLTDRIRAERPVTMARRASREVTPLVARAEVECLTAIGEAEQRIAILEGQRVPDPAEFRARSMQRMAKAIDDGADDVLKAALERLHTCVDRLREEWRGGLHAAKDRKNVAARVAEIDRTATDRFVAIGEELGKLLLRDMQSVSDTMQIWTMEEIHARYQVARTPSAIGTDAAPVVTDVHADEFARLATEPLAGVVRAFDKKRAGLSIGGAAAGALAGTLVKPGLGTAIGAVVGALAGLLQRIDRLQRDCTEKVQACLDRVEERISTELSARHANLAEAIRASLEAGFDAALERYSRSIGRMMALERRVLEGTRDQLEELAQLRLHLEECRQALTRLSELAGSDEPEGAGKRVPSAFYFD